MRETDGNSLNKMDKIFQNELIIEESDPIFILIRIEIPTE
jgi:hypothetical protein